MDIVVGEWMGGNRERALSRAMMPGQEEVELARALRQSYQHDVAGTLEVILRLDVYRARRVLVAMLDMLSDEEFDSLHREFGR